MAARWRGPSGIAALRFGANRTQPLGAGSCAPVAPWGEFFPPHMSPGKMIQLLSGASAGNQEGVSPSWTFPRRARRPRRAARPPSLVFRRARRPRRAAPVLRPSSPAGPSTAQCRRQNDQAFPNLVSHKAKRPESPQVPRPGLPSPVPPSPVNPAPRPTRRGFQRRGPQASPLVVGGVWGRNRNAPRIFLRDCQGGFFQFGKNPP